jgi:2-C-methyl-D-erythritol 2,4-cyclodiphosphate synthase
MNTALGYRTGLGYDLHRLVAGRPLVLGGVRVPHECGLLGHSDADVVLHALCDALLGAAGLGDIGELFPDSDPAWRNADSRVFVADVLGRIAAAGFRLVNADVVIQAERPRLGPLKADIRHSLSTLLALSPDAVGVKAKTNEGVDAVGRAEAIACWASVLLAKRVDAPA